MSINPKLVGKKLKPVEYSYTEKELILFALGVGAGILPEELKYVYENELEALPMFAVIPPFEAFYSFMDEDGFKVNPAMVLHGEQYFETYREIPLKDKVISYPVIKNIYDKTKGALVEIEATTWNSNKEKLFMNRFTIFIRGEGGFGGKPGSSPMIKEPEGVPDNTFEQTTFPQQAMLYRLLGDRNPLHIDPAFASIAGLDKPILHGLCSFGFAGRAIIARYCLEKKKTIKKMKARFSNYVYPGESIITEMWERKPGIIDFKSKITERNIFCLTQGEAVIN